MAWGNFQEFLQRFETGASDARERVREGEKLQHVLIKSLEEFMDQVCCDAFVDRIFSC